MIYKFNTDYEHALFNPRYFPESPKFQKFNEEYEFLFHMLSEETLMTRKFMPDEYKSHLESISKYKVNRIKEADEYSNWIGKLEDIELEKKLNSKLFTYENIPNEHKYKVCMNFDELKEFPTPCIIKSPFFYSGIGMHKIYNVDEFEKLKKWINEELSKGPLIVEELLDRDLDIGVYVNEDSTYIYKNIVDDHLQYKGTIYPFEVEIPDRIEEVKEVVKNSGGELKFNFDCFRYGDKWSICHDLNYRKSMGTHTVDFREKYYPDKVVKYSFFNQKKLKNFNSYTEMLELVSDYKGFIPLSPLGNTFFCYYVVGNDEAEIKKIEVKALDKLLA